MKILEQNVGRAFGNRKFDKILQKRGGRREK
jgi:hypothetical protein